MQALVESTDCIMSCNGVLCRVWAGQSDEGMPLYMLVACLAIDEDDVTPEIRKAMSPTPVTVADHLTPKEN